MPYVNLNGQLIEVTQEQYDIYTVGQNQNQVGTTQTPAQAAAAVAAGGTVTISNSTTSTIVTPNTTNTSPDQTLATTAVRVSEIGQITDTPADTGFVGAGEATATIGGSIATAGSSTIVAASADVSGGTLTAGTEPAASAIVTGPDAVTPGPAINAAYDDEGNLLPGYQLNENNDPIYVGDTNTSTIYYPDGTSSTASSAAALSNIQGLVKNAQQQNVIAAQRRQINNGDWRVRLRLAPQANYLYRATDPGILAPLKVTDGVIFPYTPAITTSYRANYSNYDLTHSNYRGYFYQNSYVDAVNLTATFTAQDTNDANYLLAVIHFFRSATKMFYGKDAQRGSPPPVVYLSGLGEYQFNEHSCLISQFSYNLPADVDYIRAGSPNNAGLNFNNIRDRQSVATNSIFNSINRLAAAFLTKGATNQGTNIASPPTLGLNRPTYVPTKMEIQLTLLPIQSRQQVSKQFSLEGFANGSLLKGGFW